MKQIFKPINLSGQENLVYNRFSKAVDKKIKSVISVKVIDSREFSEVLIESWEKLDLMTVDCLRYFNILLRELKDDVEVFILEEINVPNDIKCLLSNNIK